VQVNVAGQLEGLNGSKPLKFQPTEAGLRHFVLRLSSSPQQNQAWWDRLPLLDGGNRLGALKRGALELAKTPEGDPLLVVQEYGRGRTAALAVDTTWNWFRDGPPHDPRDANKQDALSESREAHLRFWRQLILWLAKQEEAGKSLRVELDYRRLAAGKEQGITVQARELTPGGSKDFQRAVRGVEFKVQVEKLTKVKRPDGSDEEKVEWTKEVTDRQPETDDGKVRHVFWHTDEPGEYRVVVSARHQGADLGTAEARFMTYRDDSELLNRTANHSLLEQLSRSTGGTYRLHGGLRSLVEELNPAAVAEATKVFKFPNWEEPNLALQLALFLLFVALIALEWLLRRIWGLV
jgi:hypothetical protein